MIIIKNINDITKKTMKHKNRFCYIAPAVLFIVALTFSSPIFAQGGGGGGGSSGSGGGSGTQTPNRDQDRDQTQDPTTHTGDEPIQDRDRIQDPLILIEDEPIQDRDQLQDRLRDQINDPDQDRDRDRIRANDPEGLQYIISAGEEASDDVANDLGAKISELARNRNRVEVSVMALIAAQNMLGQYGQQISDIAQEIHDTYRTIIQQEEQIRSRGMFRRFFFGGDSDSAETIQAQLQQNEQLMQQIRKYLNDCDCNEQVRMMLQEQFRNMEEEHTRLQQLAEKEISNWGIFSWRF